jgi:hypothetical protein
VQAIKTLSRKLIKLRFFCKNGALKQVLSWLLDFPMPVTVPPLQHTHLSPHYIPSRQQIMPASQHHLCNPPPGWSKSKNLILLSSAVSHRVVRHVKTQREALHPKSLCFLTMYRRDTLTYDKCRRVSRRPLTIKSGIDSYLVGAAFGCKKWHWDRFFSQYYGFPLSASFQQCSILIFILQWCCTVSAVDSIVK